LTVEPATTLLAELPEHQRQIALVDLVIGLRWGTVLKLKWLRANLEQHHA
jgi:hypothetical protein